MGLWKGVYIEEIHAGNDNVTRPSSLAVYCEWTKVDPIVRIFKTLLAIFELLEM